MCGITGVANLTSLEPIRQADLCQMLAMIHHRGPDGYGLYLDDRVGLGSARLSIIDLVGGDQPITNEDGTLWIVYNGEVFNYLELRRELEACGHCFSTHTDTEVILHLFEDRGPECLQALNGQFAMAIWDSARRQLFLARDRLGVRPLFYTRQAGKFLFGSEIKTLLAHPGVRASLEPAALDQVFTYWSTLSPRTAFQDIFELPPGHFLLVQDGDITIRPYWQLDFTPEPGPVRPLVETLEAFESLLVDAVQIRLRADVPVGAYLSGGLDSSVIAAIIRNYTSNHLDTFSIAFSDPDFDESPYQRQMAEFLGTRHQVVYTRHEDIGRIFPDVVWHAEAPLLRTAPAPMFLLSGLVRENGYKVVLTGEGADEFLAGYDIFKEAKIRRFWARQPGSALRPLLLRRLYPDISALPNSASYLSSFFGEGMLALDSPEYSHSIRWRNTRRARRFFSAGFHAEVEALAFSYRPDIVYPSGFERWNDLGKAQWLESAIFLPQYLLSSQGDRMAMAHSVEGRFPFLDYSVVEFCNRLQPQRKLFGLSEKYLLRKLAQKWLPEEICRRPKRPYRAPIHRSFFNASKSEWVDELLSPTSLQSSGIFKPEAVRQLVQKLEAGKRLGETDDMALAGILSTQLLYQQFVKDFRIPAPVSPQEFRKVVLTQTNTSSFRGPL